MSDGEIIAERFDVSPSAAAFAADGSRLLFEHNEKIVSFALPYDAATLRKQAMALRPPLAVIPPPP